MAYIIQLVIVFILCSLNDLIKNKFGNLFLVLTVFSLIIMSGLRIDVGTDFPNYIYLYKKLTSLYYNYDFQIEPGFYIINVLTKAMFDDVHMLFFIMAIVTVMPSYLIAKKSSSLVIMVVFLCTIYLYSFSIVRQMAAISILLIASYYLLENKIKTSIFWVAIACLLHYSSLIFLIFIFLRNIKIGLLKGIMVVFLFYVFVNMFELPKMILSSDIIQGTKYGVYENSVYNKETKLGTGLGVLLKLSPIFLTIFIFHIHKKQLDRTGCNLIILINYVFILATQLSLTIHIFNRISDIMMFVPVITGYYLYNNLKSNRSLYLGIFISLHICNYIVTIIKNPFSLGSGLGLTPYQSILDFYI